MGCGSSKGSKVLSSDMVTVLPAKSATAAGGHVLIIGAGLGGLGCALALAQAQHPEMASVTVLDSKDVFSVGALWQYVWTGRAAMELAQWSLADLHKAMPVVNVRGSTTAVSLNLGQNQVTLADGYALSYEYLVLAPGIVSDAAGIPGLSQVVDACDSGHVHRAKRELRLFVERVKAAADGKLLFLIPVGGATYKWPPLPFEMACVVDHELRLAGVREKARIAITCPSSLPVTTKVMSSAMECLRGRAREKDIELLLDHELVRLEHEPAQLGRDMTGDTWKAEYKNGKGLLAHAVFAIPPQRAPDLFKESGVTNELGLIPVDVQTNRVAGQGKNIFAIGDACHAVIPKGNAAHPKAADFAWQMGQAVAGTILASLSNNPDPKPHARCSRCTVELGGDFGAEFLMDLNPCKGAMSRMKISCKAGIAASKKLDWVNGFVQQLYGPDAREFSLPLAF